MLELDQVGYAYTPGNWIFRRVSLCLEAGAIVAALGPNGRGKTTLLHCAAGLLQPCEGMVRATARVGYVPQTHQVVFAYSTLDMVLMGRARHIGPFSTPHRRDHEVAIQALERVGLLHLSNRAFFHLSGGERQLVLIARALASESQILILDEPTSALDLKNQGRVLQLLRALARDGFAVLLTTHHPQHAHAVADQALLMYSPDMCNVGPAQQLLTESNLTELYGVQLRLHTFEENGTQRQTLAPVYEL